MSFRYLLLGIGCLLLGCRQEAKSLKQSTGEIISTWEPRYAEGFSLARTAAGITYLKVDNPWPGAARTYTYALVPGQELDRHHLPKDSLDGIIAIPASRVILTSTTHIPALETLGMEDRIVGFPGLDYISSPRTRALMEKGVIRELGSNEQLNTEHVLSLQPDVVIGFGVSGAPGGYTALEASGIPVVYNGDWMESDPLGKAEWIVFFGALLGKEEAALKAFESIEKEYLAARKLASSATRSPTVLSGALYRDIWYLPGGNSWAARFIADANARYLWADTDSRGSLALSLESVLEKGVTADFWISPSEFTSYGQMLDANTHYRQFAAFQNRQLYTYASTRGPGSGLLYFELGPSRPDLVLKDLIHWFHPGLLEDYEPYFFKPLQ